MDVKFVVEPHSDGYIAHPVGINGVIAGLGSTHQEALDNSKTALETHIKTFGDEVLDFTRVYGLYTKAK